MTVVEHQIEFLKDFARLIFKAEELGLTVTAGELMRSQEQQDLYFNEGKTTVHHSIHQDRMAGDLNCFKDGVLTYKKEDIQLLGDYWVSLNPLNRWGGNWVGFPDSPHFERNISS
jgi:hypothetical protein